MLSKASNSGRMLWGLYRMLNVSNLCRMVTPEGELRSGSQNLFLSEVEVLSTLSHPNIVRCGLRLRPRKQS